MERSVLKLVRELVAIGESGEPAAPSTAADSVPGFPAVNVHAPEIDRLLARGELADLIRGLVLWSRFHGNCHTPSRANAVNTLYLYYATRYPDSEPDLTAWIVDHRSSRFMPFGTLAGAGSRSLARYRSFIRQARRETAERRQREQDRRIRALPVKLVGAVARGDVEAARALLARGASPAAAERIAGPLSALAARNGRTRMTAFLAGRDDPRPRADSCPGSRIPP